MNYIREIFRCRNGYSGRWILILLFAFVFSFSTASVIADQILDENKADKVKAAYILNFIKFTRWPNNKFMDDKSPIVIGVLDDEHFVDTLEEIVTDKIIDQRKFVVRHIHYAKDLKATTSQIKNRKYFIDELHACHVLYMGDIWKEEMQDIAGLCSDIDVLTVGDGEHVTRNGGIIEFVYENRRIVFEINIAAVKNTEIKMSSKLLKLARIVEE